MDFVDTFARTPLIDAEDGLDTTRALARPAWHADALCQHADLAAFFPELGDQPEPARRICRRCPVQAECLAWAIEHGEIGVWGGTTEAERRAMPMRRAA